MNPFYAIMVNDNPPIVGERYLFIWPKQAIDKVNELIRGGKTIQDSIKLVETSLDKSSTSVDNSATVSSDSN